MARRRKAGIGVAGWTRQVAARQGWPIAVLLVFVGSLAWLGRPMPPKAGVDPARTAVRVYVRSADEMQWVLGLTDDVWSEHLDRWAVDIVLDEAGLEALAEAGSTYRVLVEDIDAVAQAEQARIEQAEVADADADWFAEYKSFSAVNEYLHELATAHPKLASVERVGTSLEGRKMLGLRIGVGDEARLLLNGGQHAREWISVMATTCVADRLLRRYASDPAIRDIVDRSVIHVVPVANPDGYDYSWSVDRYWRKNRREGHGVDLNRNYPVAFGGRGSSSNPRSQVYRGRHALSEPESAALHELFVSEKIDAHIDFHSYGQLLLHPWGHKRGDAPDRDRMRALGDQMVSAIHAVHGKSYKLQSGGDLYPAGGILMDWAYGQQEANSFVIELRPDRGRGFVLPPDQIIPTCDESLAATVELARWTLEHPNPR